MCPLSAPRLQFHVSRLEMVNASWREHHSSDRFRGLPSSARAMVLWDFSISLSDQCRNLIYSPLWEGDARDALAKSFDQAVGGGEAPYARRVMRPASLLENGREPCHAF
jgi:hypothetical protein